jgi:hypothetical protein
MGSPKEWEAAMETELRAVKAWSADLRGLGERLGRHFHRPEPRREAQAYLQGLLSPLERKNG